MTPTEAALAPSAEAARLRSDLKAADTSTRANALLKAAECASCAFRESDNTCRAWPPRPLADGTPIWPKVGMDHWCGCWRAM